MGPLLSAQGFGKRFGGTQALSGAGLELHGGEVVGLIGENGAGKSTLIKILCGLIAPDSGTMSWEGRAYHPRSPREAAAQGLAVIHQERHVLDNLTVAENLALGREPAAGPFLRRRESEAMAARALERVGLNLAPDTLGGVLSNAQKQLLEIARALAQQAKVVIMDEPTSSLSATEADRLLELVDELRRQGCGVLYVTHRLRELERSADRIVALRDGRPAGTLEQGQISAAAMVQLMVGRAVSSASHGAAKAGSPRLQVAGLRTARFPKQALTFEARAGEVLGVAGLVGSGRSEAARALFGIEKPMGGDVAVDGKPLRPGSVKDAIAAGLFLAPEDRKGQGIILDLSVEANIVLPSIPRLGWCVNSRASRQRAEGQAERLGIRCRSLDDLAGWLSGGNQQKTSLARWLALEAKCLILDEPTCGIDAGARQEIYRIIRGLADGGAAIVMISSDLDEILAMSDRALVFHEGAIAGELARSQLTEEAVMTLAVGHG